MTAFKSIAQVVIAYSGATRSIRGGVGMMAEDRDVGRLAVTSADRLNAGWKRTTGARSGIAARAKAIWRGCLM